MIKLSYDNQAQRGDLVREDGDGNLETDAGLETAVLVSLFTDARANEEDLDDNADRRGWWGDPYLQVQDHTLGSRLWLLRRRKATSESVNKAVGWAKEALQWLIDDKVASTVDVTMEKVSLGIYLMTVKITRPRKTAPRWERAWEVQFGL